MQSVTWKDEGRTGPVYLTDTDNNKVTDLGWHSRSWAKKYARNIGAKFNEV